MVDGMDMVKCYTTRENTRVTSMKVTGIATIDTAKDHTLGKMEIHIKANGA